MRTVKITSSKYHKNYFGLKVGDVCLVVGTRIEQLVVYKPGRNVKTNIRPYVILRKDCEWEDYKPNFFVKLYYNYVLWRVSRVLKVVNTKGIVPYKK